MLVTKDKVCQVDVHIAPAAKVSAKVQDYYNVQLHSEMIQIMELYCGPFSLSAVSFFSQVHSTLHSVLFGAADDLASA